METGNRTTTTNDENMPCSESSKKPKLDLNSTISEQQEVCKVHLLDCTDTIPNQSSDGKPLSKNRIKKLLKLKKWEVKKIDKRAKEREKTKLKKQFALENGLPLRQGPSRKELKHYKMVDSSCAVSVAIDLSFDHLMIDKDINKVVKQLLRAYTLNRRAAQSIQLYFTSVKTGGLSQSAMSKHDGYQNWDVNIYEKSFLDVFPLEKITYLTSESENVLTKLDPEGVYIIGGLVDHNSHKGLCLRQAEELKLCHARLPLDEYLKMKTRRVLTIDHVFEILLRATEGKLWKDILLQVLPLRKGAIAVEYESDENKDHDKVTNDNNENNTVDQPETKT